MSLRICLLTVLLFPTIKNFSQATYPKVVGYVGIVHPIVTNSKAGTDWNFGNHYVVGMPTGINLWKNSKVGFSMEFVPYIRSENGTSKMNNFLFHPGILLSMGKGWTFAGRAAFETSGRYGFTPVFNKVVKKFNGSSLFVAVPCPMRFGNDRPTTYTFAFQFGLVF